jgi:D-alanyl-D-alanine carboxypeptidase (penicillin-binding protein 5/6)
VSRRLVALLVATALTALAPATAAAQPGPSSPPRLAARGWAVVDARTGAIVASHAAARPLPIASTTKLMTAYVALRELPLDKIVRAAPYRAEYGESLLGLRPGQRISVRDLLYGLILRSGNDAAYELARAAAGTVPRFVRQMNRRAAALGLSDTHFANPIGLDQRGNHSSARDLATLTRHLLRIPAFAKIADSRRAVLRSVRPRRRIGSINELLSMAPWVNGVKTGHTFGARYVLVGSGRRKGVELISVVIGTWTDEERFDDSMELLRYGFSQYRRRVPIHAGEELAEPSIRWSGGSLPLRAARTVSVGLWRGQQVRLRVDAPSQVQGPLRAGAPLGTATLLVGGRPTARVPLRASRSIPRANAFDRVRGFFSEHLLLLALAAGVILIAGALAWGMRRRRRRGARDDRKRFEEERGLRQRRPDRELAE